MSDKPTSNTNINNDKKPEDPKSNTNNPPNSSNPPSNNNNNNESPSLANRIQTSASGLARNALYGSGPSADTAHLLANGGSKPGASSSSSRPSAFAAAQQYQETTGPSSASTASSRDPVPAQSFRSPSSSAQQQQQGGFALPALSEDEFQRSYGDIFSNQDETITTSIINPPHPTNPIPPQRPRRHRRPHPPRLSHIRPEFPATETEPFEPIETDLSATLTDAERTTLDSFRRQHQPSTQITSHSLIPDIGSFLDTIPASAQSDATQLRDTVLSGLPGAADWVALEEQYQDEVWGYLKPTLEAAAREMEERGDTEKDGGDNAGDGPAVRRLKMVLMHMRGWGKGTFLYTISEQPETIIKQGVSVRRLPERPLYHSAKRDSYFFII
ncbi:hypothetical protein P168DRAFT_302076 [Aspergillus campestris IBT 28561]|uniref:Uncharacterized protein n=1 Tax=Aspergillus campestris (strain IBT 28561) TaxID=1392248 RepID=A0A2I1DB21_ASPC2|nr:uncharacterized protein P168DRAFT_302076 [Aspergillus campestris IBT 28561]PKY07076.1 hypothetical protein P168DRAFT_302076 [Aspergillus campestris IBT 28561]